MKLLFQIADDYIDLIDASFFQAMDDALDHGRAADFYKRLGTLQKRMREYFLPL